MKAAQETPKFVIRQARVGGIAITAAGYPGDPYFDERTSGGDHPEAAVEVARRRLPPDAIVLDIGGNIGLVSSALAALLTNGRVISIEAGPYTAAALRRTAELAGPGRVDVVEAACGAIRGRVYFKESTTGTAWGHIVDGEVDSRLPGLVEVDMITVDELVDELELPRLDLIKVDVEGAERQVLMGASSTAARHHPMLLIELNPYALWRHGRTLPQDLMGDIAGWGSFLYRVMGDGALKPIADQQASEELLWELGTYGGLADVLVSRVPLDD